MAASVLPSRDEFTPRPPPRGSEAHFSDINSEGAHAAYVLAGQIATAGVSVVVGYLKCRRREGAFYPVHPVSTPLSTRITVYTVQCSARNTQLPL